mmetsp:Transcript_23718/g.39016  ORF Transcript_23718/g.39016 Transcript_23718/m.39016 type:complete len:388 (+) Transcript_23718:113-1276(+)
MLPDVPFALRSPHGKFLSVNDRGEVLCSSECGTHEFWTCDDCLPEKKRALTSSFGTYLSVSEDGVSLIETCGPSERFDVEVIELYCIALRASNGLYISVSGSGIVSVEKSQTPDTVFYVEDYAVVSALDELKSEGYTVLPSLITPQEAARIKAELQTLEQGGEGSRSSVQHRIPDIVYRKEIFARLLTHPVVVAIMRGYLGDNMRCAAYGSNTLLPQEASLDPGLGWHVDYPYHEMEVPWPDMPLGAQVLWLLDEFTANNGGTMFLPQTHQLLKPPASNYTNPPGSRVVQAPAGSVLLSHAAWWHRQTRNISGKTRSAALAMFVRGFVKPKRKMDEEFDKLKTAPFWERLSEPEKTTLRRTLCGPTKGGYKYEIDQHEGEVGPYDWA